MWTTMWTTPARPGKAGKARPPCSSRGCRAIGPRTAPRNPCTRAPAPRSGPPWSLGGGGAPWRGGEGSGLAKNFIVVLWGGGAAARNPVGGARVCPRVCVCAQQGCVRICECVCVRGRHGQERRRICRGQGLFDGVDMGLWGMGVARGAGAGGAVRTGSPAAPIRRAGRRRRVGVAAASRRPLH